MQNGNDYMKLLKFTMFLFYRYYSKGRSKGSAYFSALCAVVLLIYMHVFQILIVLDKVDEIIPLKKDDDPDIKDLKMGLFLLPFFLIVRYLVKPKDLRVAKYDEDKVRRSGIYLVIYCILSFVLLFALAYVFARIKRK